MLIIYSKYSIHINSKQNLRDVGIKGFGFFSRKLGLDSWQTVCELYICQAFFQDGALMSQECLNVCLVLN